MDGKTAENNPDFYKQERSKKQDAERRIEFYKRNGFTVVPCQHEIPPRKSGSPWEPSFMISSHDSLPEFFIQEIKYFPYSQVYGLVENAIRKRLPDLTVDEV
ncbi:MAG: hypothetical protein JW774_03760 [Candidatus Aureabacteria bacterium]|nr:hypothetical protein [Candidatus Auribacterota bacterium]